MKLVWRLNATCYRLGYGRPQLGLLRTPIEKSGYPTQIYELFRSKNIVVIPGLKFLGGGNRLQRSFHFSFRAASANCKSRETA